MNSNTYSSGPGEDLGAPAERLTGLAAQDPDGLADGARTERVLELRGLVDRLEGHWLQALGTADARGAAGADQAIPAPSTAGWLRARLRLGAGEAASAVRTARALFRGPFPRPVRRCWRVTSRRSMPGCWPPAPASCPTPRSGRPNRCSWRRPEGWTRPGCGERSAARLWAALVLLPPALGGPPTMPLELGRTTRVISPTQRVALAVRDGGCGFPGCDRPLSWCEGHHLLPWLEGGPTALPNLALLCRAHHRAVHEGGWQLQRQTDGCFSATPPHRRPRSAA
jgi:HNH endonuclease